MQYEALGHRLDVSRKRQSTYDAGEQKTHPKKPRVLFAMGGTTAAKRAKRRPRKGRKGPTSSRFKKRSAAARRRKRGKRSGKRTKFSRAALLKAIAEPQYIGSDCLENTVVPATTSFKTCNYQFGNVIHFDGASTLLNAASIPNIPTYVRAATDINTQLGLAGPASGRLDLKYFSIKQSLAYEWTNASNSQAEVIYYYCQARDHIPASLNNNGDREFDVSIVLADGWKAAGIQTLASSEGGGPTGAFINDQYTPYQSKGFVEKFKIYKTKKVILAPGQIYRIVLTDKKTRQIHMGQLLNATDQTANYANCSRVYSMMRHSRFIMTKMCGQMGRNAVSANTYTNPDIQLVCRFNMVYKYVDPPTSYIPDLVQTGVVTALNVQVEDIDTGMGVAFANL